ncbi:hypothetical protein ANAEL_00512 [Anaerolineales bacterium]|nr:hypothetical protein ANAEL_00512 [Anaerolineales bacterium]
MNRKLDWGGLLLFMALLFGAVVRFVPAASNGFPLNDGGLFYTMIRDLKANHFILPQITTYNFVDIPFAYPPVGFYIAAIFSTLLPVSDLQVLLWLPPLVNTLAIFFFFKLAEQILPSRTSAALAALIYALSSRAFLWQVMGGGITRSFGMVFLILMLWQAVQLFRASHRNQQNNANLLGATHPHLALTILFGALAVMSHPQTALHAVLGGLMVFLFYGRSKRGVISALWAGVGVILLSAPWWATIFLRHGFEPLLSAGQTSQRTLEFYLIVLQLHSPTNYLALPFLIFFYIGLFLSFKRREFFFITWIVIAYLIDTRGGDGVVLLAESMLAAIGLIQLSAWITRLDGNQPETVMAKPVSQILVFVSAFYFLLAASITDFQLVNTSLKPADLEMITWVNSNVEDGRTFLLSTGREFSMSDPMQEWFPALTKQHSATTLQGLEWTLSEKFFPWYEQLVDFQHCPDMDCVASWSAANGVKYDYLLVTIPPKEDESDFADYLRSLAASARDSDLLALAYESKSALVFKKK